ncbi:MAG: DUF4912 domain-containing protein [Verrucomicrobiia bacterium]
MKAKKKSSMKKKAVKSAAKAIVKRVSKAIGKKAAASSGATKSKRKKTESTQKLKKLEIPPILFEGDTPAVSTPQGAGLKYALGPEPVKNHIPKEESYELPESYGTGKLFLTARDPFWIYAAWDFSTAKIKQYNKLSSRGRMTLRVYLNEVSGKPQSEIDVYPNSRDWFIRVYVPGQTYIVALGYYDKNGVFNQVTVSEPVRTPNLIVPQPQALFELKPEQAAEQLQQPIPAGQMSEPSRLFAAQAETQPAKKTGTDLPITSEEQRELFSLVYTGVQRGSVELVKAEKGKPEVARFVAAPTGQPIQPSQLQIGISSPRGEAKAERKFWFNIQAELIVYGATEPDAVVTVANEQIKLRPDGTFTLRFALPDGFYKLSASAVSKSADQRRSVNLEFSRRTTNVEGEVGECQPDKPLPPPR